jgi:hypothetical protein
MAALMADENFPRPVVEVLRNLGHDVDTAQSLGVAHRSDVEVLEAATAEGRTLLTFDRDFIRLHRKSSAHGGIVLCTPDPDWNALAVRIDRILSTGRMGGLLRRVYRPQSP